MEPQDLDPGPNVISGVDKLWGELAAAEPTSIRARSLTPLRGGSFAVPFLERVYLVDPAGRTISGPEGDALVRDPEFHLLILGYLTGASGEGAGGLAGRPAGGVGARSQAEGAARTLAVGWVSERQLPGGSLFFQGPHALPLPPLIRRFGTDAEGFGHACRSLGGTPLEYGDAGFAFRALPLVPLAVVLWTADEEFPARASMLFDPSVCRHLPLDLVLALTHATVLRIAGAAGD